MGVRLNESARIPIYERRRTWSCWYGQEDVVGFVNWYRCNEHGVEYYETYDRPYCSPKFRPELAATLSSPA